MGSWWCHGSPRQWSVLLRCLLVNRDVFLLTVINMYRHQFDSAHPPEPAQGWQKSLRSALATWFRHSIIDEDPYDEERLIAQRVYQQLQESQHSLEV